MSKCPSCKSENVEILSRLEKSEIVLLYNKMSIDCSELFKKVDCLSYCACKSCALRFFFPFVVGDNKFYMQLQNMDWYFLHENKTEYEFSPKFIKQADKILDVGSGRGVFSKYISSAFYQGLDTSTKAVELAKNDGTNVICETIEAHSVKFKNFYNVVVAFQVLEHITSIDSFIKSCLDSLTHDGYFIIAVPNNDSFLQYATNNALNLPPHHHLHWNETSLKNLSYRYNLDVVCVFKEPVTKIHRHWYLKTVIANKIKKFFQIKHKLIDNSIQHKILVKISSSIAKIVNMKIQPGSVGHSIIIVCKKQ